MKLEEIKKLPNLLGVVNQILEEEHLALEQCSLPPSIFNPNPTSIHIPRIEYYNDFDVNKFIAVRLTSREKNRPEKFAFKPNLKNRMFLFRGQSGFYEQSSPSLLRKREGRYVVENIMFEEFRLALNDHPLIRLFRDGIVLGGHRYYFEVNYYGLAQHYGLKTSVMDLTSDMEVAKFFAVTDCKDGTDKYTPVIDERRYGVMYYWDNVRRHDAFQISENGNNLSTIGMQAFPRSGKQCGFLYSMFRGQNFHDSPFVKYKLFRHEASISRQVFREAKKGAEYFPKDELSSLARRIKDSHVLSGEAFENNLRINPQDDKNKNYSDCLSEHISIDFRKRHITFNATEKEIFHQRLKNGFWQDFCSQIIFPKDIDGSIMGEFIKLPENPLYKQYFVWK